MFPDAPAGGEANQWGRSAIRAAAYLAAIAAGAVVLVLRIGGGSPLDTIWAEDGSVFLPWALAHPWHLLTPYAGYLQLLPRMIGQLAALLPLRDAAKVFTGCGVVIDSAVAVFVWHASAGHVRSGWLRGLLAAAVLLLSVAPLEIADSGVNTVWYLLLALFWAALWRPRTKAGMALAALIGFFAAASNPLSVVFAPLFAVRVFALRRVREHAVTAGWVVGTLLQLPVIHEARRSRIGALAPPRTSLGFYLHDVVLRLPGWRLSWRLEEALANKPTSKADAISAKIGTIISQVSHIGGPKGTQPGGGVIPLQSTPGLHAAVALVGCALAVLLIAIVVLSGARIRLFTAAAVGTGLLLAVTGSTVTNWVGVLPVYRYNEPGSRYTTLPIFLLQATFIVAVDAVLTRALERRRPSADAEAVNAEALYADAPDAGANYPDAPYPEDPYEQAPYEQAPYEQAPYEQAPRAGRGVPRYAAAVAVVALVAGLGAGWVTDFRNADGRGSTPPWAPAANHWLSVCRDSPPGGSVTVKILELHQIAVPCANIRP